jgi:hypothetical protein
LVMAQFPDPLVVDVVVDVVVERERSSGSGK